MSVCGYHARRSVHAVRPETWQWAQRMIDAKRMLDRDDSFLNWELAYDQFVDCDTCTHEVLIILSNLAATA